GATKIAKWLCASVAQCFVFLRVLDPPLPCRGCVVRDDGGVGGHGEEHTTEPQRHRAFLSSGLYKQPAGATKIAKWLCASVALCFAFLRVLDPPLPCLGCVVRVNRGLGGN